MQCAHRASTLLASHSLWRRPEGQTEPAVADPGAVDTDAVKAEVPYGIVAVRAVAGGLNVPPVEGTTDGVVIANAAILVSFPE